MRDPLNEDMDQPFLDGQSILAYLTNARVTRSSLPERVASDIEDIVKTRAQDFRGRPELPTDPTTYRDAHASAIRLCRHVRKIPKLNGDLWCLDCDKIVGVLWRS